MQTIDMLKLSCVKETDRWVVLMGHEVTLVTGEKKLQPGIVVGRGATRDEALYDATWTLRELGRRIDWGTL